jgi:PAS domain-containing protein
LVVVVVMPMLVENVRMVRMCEELIGSFSGGGFAGITLATSAFDHAPLMLLLNNDEQRHLFADSAFSTAFGWMSDVSKAP